MSVTCSICLEPTKEIGELPCCHHRFCWPCITAWAERESRCPLCKRRFGSISRKALYAGDPFNATAGAAAAAAAAGAAGAGSRPDDDDADDGPARKRPRASEDSRAPPAPAAEEAAAPESPKGCLDGVVLEVKRVAAKDQVGSAFASVLQPPSLADWLADWRREQSGRPGGLGVLSSAGPVP